MRDGEAGSQRRPMAAIKNEELFRFPIVERTYDAAPQIFAGPGGAEPFAFDTQERDFVERIDHSQACIEFQAVDNAYRIAETDMLRPQVAVTIDDMPRSHAFGEKIGPLGQKPTLHGIDVPHAPRWKAKSRVEQNTAIERKTAPPLRGMGFW